MSPKERQPLTGSYRGYGIITMPPPSSGGIVLLQVLNMLEAYDLKDMGHNSAAELHLYIEAIAASVCRPRGVYGRPGFCRCSGCGLIDKEYAAKRVEKFNLKHATPSSESKARSDHYYRRHATTHFTVVDADGNDCDKYLYDERSLRIAGYGKGNGRSAQRRNGRLRRAAGKAEYVRADSRRTE